MAEITISRLSDIALVVDCEHKTAPLVDSSDIYSIRTADILNGRIDFDSANNVAESTYQEWTRREAPVEGDIILAREAPVGEVGLVPKGRRVCLGQRTVLIRAYGSEVDPRYLCYLLTAPEVKTDLISRSTGSVVEHLNVEDIRNFEISYPTLPEQRAIAGVLSSLDDKIELLHWQNKTLEGMAEALWRKMFVEEADSGWKITTLGKVAKFNEKSIDRDYPFDQIEYLDTGSIVDGAVSEFEYLRLEAAPTRARRIVRKDDVILSLVRPIQKHYGILKQVNDNTIVSTGFAVMTCVNVDPHFVYLLLTQNDMTEYLDMVAEASTSAYPSLVPSDLEQLEFQMPPAGPMGAFSEYASRTWGKIDENQSQIRTLSRLRDALLPKLMSGEVRVTA